VVAFVSFGSGLVLLVAYVLILPAGRRGLRRLSGALRGHRLKWWRRVGGASEAFLVTRRVPAVAIAVANQFGHPICHC
jgi:transporter family-2 protein